MPDIQISEECRALIAVEFEIDETPRRLPNGNWQIPIDEETWRRLQKVQLSGEIGPIFSGPYRMRLEGLVSKREGGDHTLSPWRGAMGSSCVSFADDPRN